ncbi:MAG: translocation/assembly module TamB domain-containing protein [Lautropia sp.]|nr:translocation/assembly module TamB domain-containing protein [Lautropia sp.]
MEPIGRAGAPVVAGRPAETKAAETKAAGASAAGARAAEAGSAEAGSGGLSVSATAADASLAAELEAVIVGGRKLQIGRAQVQFKDRGPGGAGRASFLGSVGLAAPWPVDLSGDLRNVDPAQLVQMPPALLSGTWRVSGRMAADGGGSGQGGGLLQTYLALDESRFRGLPLAGRLAATLSVRGRQLRQLSAVHGAMRWGSGTVDVAGALGGAADVLRLTVNLPKLGEVQEGMTGAVSGHASLGGSLDAPALEARLDGKQLAAAAGDARARIAGAVLQLRTTSLRSGPLHLQADLDGVEVGSTISERPGRAPAGLLSLGRVTAVVEGSPADHRIDADAVGAGQRLALGAHGGIGDDGLWRGVVNRLAASHPFLEMPAAGGPAATAADLAPPAEGNRPQADFRSLQPFAVVAGIGRVTLRNVRFELHGARLNLRQADWQAPVLTLSAEATGVAARWFDRFGKLDALPRDLTVAAAVDFTGNLDQADATGWRGRIRLQRETGDLALRGPGGADPVPAGLRTLQASLSIDERKLDLVVNVEGENIGRIAAEARTTLPRGSEPAWKAASIARSPLAGRLDLAVNSFRWILPLEDESWRVDGALSARLQLAGTLGNPRAQGAVTGNNLSAEEQTLGMRLSNGVLAAELIGDRIDVKLLRFESGAGSVAVSGLLQPAGGGRSQARIVIDRLPIPLGIGERVVLSGSTTTTLAGHALSVAGRLVAEDGIIELKGGSAPDVALDAAVADEGVPGFPARGGLPDAARRPVVSRSADVAGGAAPGEGAAHAGAVKARAFGIDTDVEMDLGRRFRVAGSGLDANLRGAIRLRGYYPQPPRATGTVELANGSYRFHGRELRIKRGRIVFDGPLDDPALDIVAVRDNLKIEPAVELGGTAVAPVVRLASTPDVSDAEKLAWLGLGASPATRSAGQLATLQRAAATLFGGEAAAFVAGFTGKPGAEPEGSPGAVAMVGQRLASRLSATYGQSLRGVWNILKLQYEVTDRLSLSAQAGSDSAAELFRSNSSD